MLKVRAAAANFHVARWLLAVVVLYGALLRFDALTLIYGPVGRPAWLRAIQQTRRVESVLRPHSFRWEPHVGRYTSDPYTYLRYAREMRSFYAAHRREPVFPAATKLSLWLLADQDVAVSFASAAFSVLAILSTYLLGAAAFSRWVGLGAAAALAIEYDVVTWGVGGWRDDAFMCVVALSAYAVLRAVLEPSWHTAALLGVTGGLACLVRITSLSFLIPGLACVAFFAAGGWRQRLGTAGTATLIAAIITGPYLFNCWRVFGDPLYSINVHADIYRQAADRSAVRSETAADFLTRTARQHPVRSLETAILGMTSYPFSIKWQGFDRWNRWLPTVLSWASLAGLFLFVGSLQGRILLMVLITSLVPYAMTWRLIGDWRFTEHAYPLFLIAAFHAVAAVATAMARAASLRRLRPMSIPRTRIILWTGSAAAVVMVVWLVNRVLPVRVAAESLRTNEPVTIGGTERDTAFFVSGWSAPYVEGNVKARISESPHPKIALPLPRRQDYGMTVRMDPYPRPSDALEPLPTVRVFVNDHLVSIQNLRWDPSRVGSYDMRVPAEAIRDGANRLSLVATRPSGESARIRVWYVRVRPPAG